MTPKIKFFSLIFRLKTKKQNKKLQMALWRVLDYTSATLRVAVKHPPNNSLNSDKKVNSKPSETGRSPLNRLANRPIILRSSAYLEFYSFLYIPSVFLLRFVSDGVFCAVLFCCLKSILQPFRSHFSSLQKPL